LVVFFIHVLRARKSFHADSHRWKTLIFADFFSLQFKICANPRPNSFNLRETVFAGVPAEGRQGLPEWHE
jgi:hypothetical protein